MVVNELIRAYGWMGLVLPEVGLLLVGLGFLGLQYGARQVVVGRAAPDGPAARWGNVLAEEGAGVTALLTVCSLGGWLFGRWCAGLLLGCGLLLLLVLLAVLGELLQTVAREAVRMLKLIPPLEAELLRMAVAGAESSARQGCPDVGFERLRAGLRRAEAARDRDEPWASELICRYRQAIEHYETTALGSRLSALSGEAARRLASSQPSTEHREPRAAPKALTGSYR